jgi:hypothetical protein
MHLAAKERELAIKRCTAIRDGLGARISHEVRLGVVRGGQGGLARTGGTGDRLQPPIKRHHKA